MSSVGCAGGASDARSVGSGSATRIVRADLDEVRHLSDAYEAVRLLRPAWLRSRGSTLAARNLTAEVVFDGIVMLNGLNALRSIRTDHVETMDYISASDATTRYGTGFPAGAIVVISRR